MIGQSLWGMAGKDRTAVILRDLLHVWQRRVRITKDSVDKILALCTLAKAAGLKWNPEISQSVRDILQPKRYKKARKKIVPIPMMYFPMEPENDDISVLSFRTFSCYGVTFRVTNVSFPKCPS